MSGAGRRDAPRLAAPRLTPPRLTPPTAAFHASFLTALDEYHDEGGHLELDASLLADPAEFARYLEALLDEVSRPGSWARYVARIPGAAALDPPGYEYVPQTVLWWVAGDAYIGRVSIRHRLTPDLMREGGNIGYEVRPSARGRGYATAILAAALPLAADLGVGPALIDCEADNLASQRVLEKCGGRIQRREGGSLYYLVPTR